MKRLFLLFLIVSTNCFASLGIINPSSNKEINEHTRNLIAKTATPYIDTISKGIAIYVDTFYIYKDKNCVFTISSSIGGNEDESDTIILYLDSINQKNLISENFDSEKECVENSKKIIDENIRAILKSFKSRVDNVLEKRKENKKINKQFI